MIEIEYPKGINNFEELKNKYVNMIAVLKTNIINDNILGFKILFINDKDIDFSSADGFEIPHQYFKGINAIGIEPKNYSTLEELVDKVFYYIFR